jgi:hypothetical protein
VIAGTATGTEIRVVHFVPGRIRLKIERLKTDPDFADQLRSWIPKVPGLRSLQINQTSSSIVVSYDPEKISLATLARFVPGIVPPGTSPTELQERLSQAVRGGALVWRFDSQTLLQICLALFGMRSLLGGTKLQPSLVGILVGAGLAVTRRWPITR